MKILYVTTISNTVNTFLIPHIKMLIDQGHQVDVAFNIVEDVKKEIIELGCKVHQIEFQRSPLSIQNKSAYKRLKKLICSEKYDIVHTHTPIASAFVRLACRKLNTVKVFYTAHGFHFYKGASLKNWLLFYPIEKWLSRYTDCLITINKEDFLIAKNKKFKAKEIRHIHGVGVDLTKFNKEDLTKKYELRERFGFDKEDLILIYPAELNKNKNQKVLIDMVDILKEKIPNLLLILPGKGRLLETYKNLVKDKGLTEKILFPGYISNVDEYLKLSDISVASSIREGLPINIIESMACGLPVVASKNRGHNELVKHEKNGYLVDYNNPKKFADAVYKLFLNKNERESMGNKNTELVKKYSIENIKSELSDIYKKYL